MCRTKYFPKKGNIITVSQGAISVLIARRCILLISPVNCLSRLAVLRSCTAGRAGSCTWLAMDGPVGRGAQRDATLGSTFIFLLD